MQREPIYKIADRRAWTEAVAAGVYRGSLDDLRDGFIHFSTGGQLAGTARRHFSGRMDLVLIAIDASLLGDELKWEPSRGGALFPHLYADLPTASALWVRDLRLCADGMPDIDAALLETRP
jgi:uncharacterized protein (DUF952 family)